MKSFKYLWCIGVFFGILGIIFSLIAETVWLGIIMGIVVLVFGVISLKKDEHSTFSVVPIVLTVVILILSVFTFISSGGEGISPVSDDSPSEKTETLSGEDLSEYIKVEIGEFEVTEDGFIPETSLSLKITNLSDKNLSFSVKIDAVNSEGNIICSDSVSVESLSSGKSCEKKVFKNVEAQLLSEIKKATFVVSEIVSE